jgi:hypothetical protein
MWILVLVQVLIDLVFAFALLVLIAKHISGRTTHDEIAVIKATLKGWWVKYVVARFDGGEKPK